MALLEILDVGSNKGKALKANTVEALRALGYDMAVEEVRDVDRLLAYGISGIPALALNGRVIVQKLVPSPQELRVILTTLLAPAYASSFRLRTIVAPTDFSEVALNALAYAKSVAAVQGAGLNVVHVHQPAALPGAPYLAGMAPEDLEWKHAQLNAFLEKPVFTNGFDAGKVPIRSEMLVGATVDEIKQLSKHPDTDMIIMGATGTGNLLNRILGSVSSEVARKASCPVLLVPRDSRFRGWKRMIFAGNYEPHEDKVLPRLLELAKKFESEAQYVHIHTVPSESFMIGRVHLTSAGHSFSEIISIESTSVLEGLHRYAQEQKADLIVMSTTHRPFAEALFHRSVTKQAALSLQTPLLILHPNDAEAIPAV